MANSSTCTCPPPLEVDATGTKLLCSGKHHDERPSTTSDSSPERLPSPPPPCFPASPAYLCRSPYEAFNRNSPLTSSASASARPSSNTMSRMNSRAGVLSPATSRRRSFRGCCPSPCSCSSPLSPIDSLHPSSSVPLSSSSSSPSFSSSQSSLTPLGTAHALLCPPPCLATLVSWLLSSYLSFIASLFDSSGGRDSSNSSTGSRNPSGALVSHSHSSSPLSPTRSSSLPCTRLFSSPSLRATRTRNNSSSSNSLAAAPVSNSRTTTTSTESPWTNSNTNTPGTPPLTAVDSNPDPTSPLLGTSSGSMAPKPGFPGSQGAGSSRVSFSSTGTSFSAGYCSNTSSPGVHSKEGEGRGSREGGDARRSLGWVLSSVSGGREGEEEEEGGSGHQMTFRMEWGSGAVSSEAAVSGRGNVKHEDSGTSGEDACVPLIALSREEREELRQEEGEKSGSRGGGKEVPVSARRSYWEDEDCCPTCLEEYNDANPKIDTECGHHFHLVCIYEWMERSPLCPVCMRTMAFKESSM